MPAARFLKHILLSFFVLLALGASLTRAQAVAPTLLSVNPTSGTPGSSLNLTFTGTGFTTATADTVTFTGTTGSNTGVATIVGSADAASATSLSITASLPTPADTYNVTVTNSNGTSNTVSFTINNPLPTITSLTPSSGVAGTTVPTLVIAGTGFVAGATVQFNGTTLAAGSVTVNNATQITVTNLTLPGTPGTATFTVTNPAPGGGTSTPATNFSVTPPAPTLTAVSSSPASAVKGTSVTLTLTGTGFTTATADTVTFTGTSTGNTGTVTFGSANAASATSLSITASLPTPADTYNVKVTNANGSSGTVALVVNNPLPTITSLTPNTGVAGTTVSSLVIAGTGFVTGAGGSTVHILGTDGTTTLTPGSVTVNSATQITVTNLTLPGTPGTATFTVTDPLPGGGTSSAANFTVVLAAPTLTSITPASGIAGSTATLTFSGTAFTTTTVNTVSFTGTTGSNAGIVTTFGSAPAGSPTSLAFSGLLPAADSYTVKVTNANGSSAPLPFTVTNPVPAIVSLTPNAGGSGTTVASLVISGAGFLTGAGGSAVQVNGAALAASSVTVNSAAQITVTNLTLPVVTTLTHLSVTVTNPGSGASAAATFTVNPAPALTSVTSVPSSALQNTGVTLTLTGTGFTTDSPNTVLFNAGGSITFGQAKSADGVTLIVTGTLPAQGAYTVVVANVNGTTSPGVPFAVSPSSLTLTSVSSNIPADIEGKVVTLTLSGTNFGEGTAVNQVIFTNTASQTFDFGLPTTSADGTTLIVSGTLPPAAGPYTVTVTSGTLTTNAVGFTVNNPAPTISSLAPQPADPNGAAALFNSTVTSFVITGTGFIPGVTTLAFQNSAGADVTELLLGSPVSATVSVDSNTQITVSNFAASPSATAGVFSVIAENTPGGNSNPQTYTVYYPSPTISSVLDPNNHTSDPAGTSPTLSIHGSFVSGTTSVVILGTDGVTQLPLSGVLVTPGLITATVTLPATPGTLTVTVSNPPVNGIGGGVSTVPSTANASVTPFTVTAAPLTLNPAFAYVGDPSIVLTITTTGSFLPALPSGAQTTVTITPVGGTAPVKLDATLLNASTLTVPLPPAGFPVATAYTVTVNQTGIAPISATFFALPLGPIASGTTANPVVTLTDPATLPSTKTTAYFSAPQKKGLDGVLLFSAPYDYTAPADTAGLTAGQSVLAEVTLNPFSTAYVPYSNLAVWDPTTDAYDVIDTSATITAPALGKGYWGRFPAVSASSATVIGLVSRGTNARSLPTGAGPIDGQGRFMIPLHLGWNMIGDPWAETEGVTPTGVLLQNLLVSPAATPLVTQTLTDADASGLISAVFYQYDPAGAKYETVSGFASGTKILPYVGYWVHAERDCTLLVPQP